MITNEPLPDLLQRLDAYWRAAKLPRRGPDLPARQPAAGRAAPTIAHQPRLLGHWGTTPGQNFIYAHLNRVITALDLNMIYLSGPGHGGPAVVANVYLEGTYSEIYPAITQDRAGLAALFRQFSFPGGIPSHVAPETPGAFTKAASWAIRSVTRLARSSTTPTSLPRASSCDGEARDRAAGDGLALEQISQSCD